MSEHIAISTAGSHSEFAVSGSARGSWEVACVHAHSRLKVTKSLTIKRRKRYSQLGGGAHLSGRSFLLEFLRAGRDFKGRGRRCAWVTGNNFLGKHATSDKTSTVAVFDPGVS